VGKGKASARRLMKSNRWTDLDRGFMGEALKLARRGRTMVEPNPAVGAVIVKSGKIIAVGYHKRFGGPHAEVGALEGARSQGVGSLGGGSMYVTLEPCCHWGKTGPCTEAIIRGGINRVVVACSDPSGDVNGRGIRALRKAGVKVEVGLMADEARELNAWFFKYHRTGRPWVIGKWAQTLDGKLGCGSGESKWISSQPSRKEVHKLRRSVQAIVTGIDTVLADDPELTVRLVKPNPAGPPIRAVLDTRLRVPLGSKLVTSAATGPVLIFTGPNASRTRRMTLLNRGCRIVEVRRLTAGPGPRMSGLDLGEVLDELAKLGAARVLVEAGPRLASGFLAADLLDEVVICQSPKLAMDHRARQLSGQNARQVADFLDRFRYHAVRKRGDDLILVLWRKRQGAVWQNR